MKVKYLFLALVAAILVSSPATAALPYHRWQWTDSFFDITLDYNAIGQFSFEASGPMQMSYSDTYLDADSSLYRIDTEIVSMDLTGSFARGRAVITARNEGMTGGAGPGAVFGHHFDLTNPDLPADSFFDIFFEIEVDGQMFHTMSAAHYEGTANGLSDILLGLTGPVTLYDTTHTAAGQINGSALHITPEPSGLLALAGGLFPLGFFLRRRIKR